MSKKFNYKTKMTKKKVAFSIIGVVAIMVLFLCIEYLREKVMYGVFGYAIYAYLPALLTFAILLLIDRKPNVSLKNGILYVSLFIMIVVTLHTGLHKNIIEGTSYVNNTYTSHTVGGVLIGLIVGLFRLICAGNYAIVFALTFVITALLGLVAIYPLLLEVGKNKSKEKRNKQDNITSSTRVNNLFRNEDGEYVEGLSEQEPSVEENTSLLGYGNVVNVSGMNNELFSSLTSEQDRYRSKADRSASILFGSGNLQEECNSSSTKIDRNNYSTLNTLGQERGLNTFNLSQDRKREVEEKLRPLSPEEEYNLRYGEVSFAQTTNTQYPMNSTSYLNNQTTPPEMMPIQKIEEPQPVKSAPILDRASALDYINTPLSGEELINMDFSRPQKKQQDDYSYMFDDTVQPITPQVEPIPGYEVEKEELPFNDEPIVTHKVENRDIEPLNQEIAVEPVIQEAKEERPIVQTAQERPVVHAVQEKPKTMVQEKFNIPTKQPKSVYTSNVMAKEKAPVFPDTKNEGVKKPYVPKPYKVPSFDLLNSHAESTVNFPEDYEIVAEKLNQTMREFDVPAEVFDAKKGPAFTMYYLRVGVGYKLSKISSLKENLKMRLCVKNLRIHAPIEGQDALGIELPNAKREIVGLKSILSSTAFNEDSKGLKIGMGKTLEGTPYVADITKMPHLLVAGSTGTGKSVFLNAVLTSLIYKYSPEQLRMVLIDPKKVELTVYRNLPNLLIKEPVKEAKHAVNALRWLCEEMDRRYDFFSKVGCANIDQYNDTFRNKEDPPMYRILLVIDEMADLMMNSKDSTVESSIVRIAQLARACGIHMIIATQRPTVKVITGLIKSNIIHRVAFTVKTNMDSRVILDDGGAEELLGWGDMLYSNSNGLVRLQGALVEIDEIKAICDFIRENNECDFDDTIAKAVSYEPPKPETAEERSAQREEERDAEFEKQLQIILKSFIATGRASVSSAQSSHHVGYIKARKLVDEMTKRGFLSPGEGAKPRDILITMEEWEELFGEKSIAQEFANMETYDDEE